MWDGHSNASSGPRVSQREDTKEPSVGRLGRCVHKAIVWLRRPAMTLEVSMRVLKPFCFVSVEEKNVKGYLH